tara:strand:- start:8744 stop:9736 length:993 start_codon:yes stop_codon:yes gene_type:complete
MIIKNFEINKININNFKIFLLYGPNEGYKDEIIENELSNSVRNIEKYDEKQVLENLHIFFSKLFNKSFFDEDKTIIVSRVSDKILDLIKKILERDLDDVKIFLKAGILDKRSKLRIFFEKEQKLACLPFYEDNKRTLVNIAYSFFKEKKYSISQECINIIVERSNGDRKHLLNEINKIILYKGENQKIRSEEVLKLTNLSENYGFNELVDNCLSKNLSRTSKIINENHFSVEDCILILRILLQKSKRVLNLLKLISVSKNIDQEILKYKPPIFWKDKEIVKKQIVNWSQNDIENLIFKVNDLELLIKKNNINSLNILFDFLLSKSKKANN